MPTKTAPTNGTRFNPLITAIHMRNLAFALRKGTVSPDVAADILDQLAALLFDTAGFFNSRSIDQLIAEQHVQPIADISVLSGAIPDEDVDEFVADIYRDRMETEET